MFLLQDLGLDAEFPMHVVCQCPPQGLEQSENSSRRVRVSETGGAKSGAVDRENASFDPNLAIVIDAWHSLPPDTRTAILAIVEAALGR